MPEAVFIWVNFTHMHYLAHPYHAGKVSASPALSSPYHIHDRPTDRTSALCSIS